ncbi:tRNA 2-thiouridine(34) synthase MnmA [Paucidesulfovibrio longus]|uniref:tRNA 2-thiouridine(34) synthase MnmA n=1 Tax=Paucidesulfovibrio longus TaxID=889 RepID=UPI0003B4C00C|nr:tRNA 2-thiouridine(34) synthase MnmA [Paucidesulfovibrio longus]
MRSSDARRVVAAVSGGMDSLLALALLKEQGHDVVAAHGLFLPDSRADSPSVQGLERQCAGLGVPLRVLDMRREFRRCVTDVFAAEYRAGRTPNPCALCNPRIKFGALFELAREFGAEAVATGHYAWLDAAEEYGAGPLLLRGTDLSKDQSYFLSLLPPRVLDKVIFPLGGLRKRDVPAELARRGLVPPLSGESQEICFIPGDDYRAWLEANAPDLPGGGAMLVRNAEGKAEQEVGRHGGLWRYTQGQRRGLGVAWSEPLYVLDKDTARNALILGTREQGNCMACEAGEANLFVPAEKWPEKLLVQTRYRQRAEPAKACLVAGRLRLRFERPHERPAPGQVAALYDEQGRVLAGGILDRVLD